MKTDVKTEVTAFPFDDALRATIKGHLDRFEVRRQSDPGSLRHAAVAVAVIEGDVPGQAAFLLTKRTPKLRAHGGQWALPGGRVDPGETIRHTALRELHEELGVLASIDDVLGTLDDYPTRSGYLITPVVVWVSTDTTLVPNPAEVHSVHHIALDKIERDDAFSFTTIPESTRRVIRFRLDGQHIHAPTAALIYQFREVLAGRNTRVVDLEQPVFAWK